MSLHAFAYEISLLYVIPAKAGIQEHQEGLDPGFRRGDDQEGSCEVRKFLIGSNWPPLRPAA